MEPFRRKDVYSPYDMAEVCGVDFEAVRDWFAHKRLPFFEIPGGHYRVTHADFEKFLEGTKLPKPEGWEGEGTKYRVLVVEDDQDLLEIMGDFLVDELRLEVRKENNGFSAGLLISSWRPDLILLDFVMPGMNGFEICRKLRENPKTQDIPVLAVTSLKAFENKKAILESGVSDYIQKPFHSEDFLRKVKTLLGFEVGSPTKS